MRGTSSDPKSSLPGNRREHEQGKETFTFHRSFGPVVVDVWPARNPSGAPPVLLIHGWGASSRYWDETAADLAETTLVIVPDLPGVGRSLPVQRTLNLADQVAAMRGLLDDLGIQRVQVVGHSMGAAVGLLLADAQPERFTRLVLIAMVLFMTRGQQTVYRGVMKMTSLFLHFRHDALAYVPMFPKLAAKRYFYRVPNDPNLLRQGMLDFLQMDRATAMACADDACDDRIPQAAARLRQPVMLVVCREDSVTPNENVDYTAQTIPNSQVRWLEECAHLPMLEQPEEFMAILYEFLELGRPQPGAA